MITCLIDHRIWCIAFASQLLVTLLRAGYGRWWRCRNRPPSPDEYGTRVRAPAPTWHRRAPPLLHHAQTKTRSNLLPVGPHGYNADIGVASELLDGEDALPAVEQLLCNR